MAGSLKNLSIMLVEDHRQLAQTVLEFLEEEGASVDYAGDASLARELLRLTAEQSRLAGIVEGARPD